MANYTPNLNLKKPLTTEKYDMVADLNDTKDKIDTQGAVKRIKEKAKKDHPIQWGATYRISYTKSTGICL